MSRNETPYGPVGMSIGWFVIAMLIIAFSYLSGLWYSDLVARFAQ